MAPFIGVPLEPEGDAGVATSQRYLTATIEVEA